MEAQFSFHRVGGEYIDAYGHVNYKGGPALFEAAQDEFLARCTNKAHLSFDYIQTHFGCRSFVKKIETTYYRELKKDDVYQVRTRLRLGNTSMTFDQELMVVDILAITLSMVVVLVDREGKPTPVPPELRSLLEGA